MPNPTYTRTKKDRKRNKVIYDAYECLDGTFIARSVAPWPLTRQQLVEWGEKAGITIRFIPRKHKERQ